MRVRLVDNDSLHTYYQRSALTTLTSNCDCGIAPGQVYIPPIANPTIYSLELTPSCNNRCPGCSNVFIEDTYTRRMLLARKPMPFERWRVVLDAIAPFVQQLKVTGGEATQHPEFEQIIGYIQERGIEFTLFTNGRWKSPGDIIALLQATPACAGLLISLHGADAATHDAFTGVRGSFDETTHNIRRASAAGIAVHTSTVFTSRNHTQIEAILQLSGQLGAACAVFNRWIGQPAPGLDLSPADLRKAVRQVDQRAQRSQAARFGTCVPLCFVESSSTGCLAGTAYCTIDPWGNIRPCNHAPQIIGNLLDSALKEIWQSASMDAWRNLIPAACRTCAAFGACRGGCRAEMVLHDHAADPLMSGPLQPDAALLDIEDEVCLYERAVPALEYLFHEEAFGSVLVKGSAIIPLPDVARSVISALSYGPTLLDIQRCFGDEGVSVIGDLYQQGAVTLHW